MEWVTWVVGAVVVLIGIDRLFLAAERRGWIYWRRRPPSASTAGSALLSVQALFEPGKDAIVHEQRRVDADIDVAEDDDPLG